MRRILVVEDDAKLGEQVAASLRQAGYDVVWASRGDEALASDFSALDLVILDLMLPGAHGFDVLKALRSEHRHLPVIVLSARHEPRTIVDALHIGADDYLAKPFWPEELLARVQARLRRPAVVGDTRVVRSGALEIDMDARTASVADVPVELTRVEFDLLAALARRQGSATSRGWLVEQLLDPSGDRNDRALDVHMSRLRRKLGPAAARIATVWGIGYRLEADPS
jgi:two-component system response regulator MtrA